MEMNTLRHDKIKIMKKNDWEIYRSLRLRSLQESPDSFGSTYERELTYTSTQWQTRLETANRTLHALPLMAVVDTSPVGLAWGRIHEPDDTTVNVYQMWVAPETRGQGVGRALLDQIVLWTKEVKLKTVSLHVTTSNFEAIALYASSGFISHGKTEALRPGSQLNVQPMILSLPVEQA
jgi:ribosomal protein S18 acetylase RimI-like enzyme